MHLICLLVVQLYWSLDDNRVYCTLLNLVLTYITVSKGKQQFLPHTLCMKNILSVGFLSNPIKRPTAEKEAESISCSQCIRQEFPDLAESLERTFCGIKLPNMKTKEAFKTNLSEMYHTFTQNIEQGLLSQR